MNVSTIRQMHQEKYWVLIWYFCTMKLPYEFFIPYEEKALAEDFYRDYLTVKRQLYFDEQVQYFGLEYFNKRVE